MFNLTADRPRLFAAGFLGGLLLFAAANLYSYHQMGSERVLTDAYVGFGLPLTVYVTGGLAGAAILWANLFANLALAVLASLALGWLVAKLSGRGPRLP